jgi:hypothetical protein
MHEKSNISANSTPKSKIFLDFYQEPGWVCLAKPLKRKKFPCTRDNFRRGEHVFIENL